MAKTKAVLSNKKRREVAKQFPKRKHNEHSFSDADYRALPKGN